MSVRAKFNEIIAHEFESQHSAMNYQQPSPLITTPPYYTTTTPSPSSNEPNQQLGLAYENSTTKNYFNNFQPDGTY